MSPPGQLRWWDPACGARWPRYCRPNSTRMQSGPSPAAPRRRGTGGGGFEDLRPCSPQRSQRHRRGPAPIRTPVVIPRGRHSSQGGWPESHRLPTPIMPKLLTSGSRRLSPGSGAVRPPLDASQSATESITRTRVRILPRPPETASPKGPSCSAKAWSSSADLGLGPGGYCRLSLLSPERRAPTRRGHARKMCAVPLDAYPYSIRRLTRPPTYRHSMCGGSEDGGFATPV
jgi:hypothetical protein